jgi:hypothetical protein
VDERRVARRCPARVPTAATRAVVSTPATFGLARPCSAATAPRRCPTCRSGTPTRWCKSAKWPSSRTTQSSIRILVNNTSGSAVPQLIPGQPGQMLGEAINHLKSLPRNAANRADVFEALARQIESHSGGAWSAARGRGTDGSVIFLGRQGEGLVVAPNGRIFRGAVGRGIDIIPNGLRPDLSSLTPLD